MDINRNQYFMAGVVILLLGVQLRMVESYVLNEESSQFVAERIKRDPATMSGPVAEIFSATSFGGSSRQMFQPPQWLGWALISVGAVLSLHALAMKKPD